MKLSNLTDPSIAKSTEIDHVPVKVCMHIRGVVNLDARVMRAATALNGAGYSINIVDIENDRTRPPMEDIFGIRVRHMLRPDWLIPTRLPWRLVKSVQKLIGSTFWLLRIPADIYHAHNVNALVPCYIAAQLRRKLLIFEAHEMPLYELEKTKHQWSRALITWLFVAMLHRCAGVITVSQPIIQEMYHRYQVTGIALIRNIPYYQEVPSSNRLREHFGLSSKVRIVLYQGNLQHDRNLDKLVMAAKFLERDIVIVLMGKGVGATPSELEALAARDGVVDRLKFLPPVSNKELLDWTTSADLGINVSSPDYSLNTRMFLPNKLFEYLMAGLPVLSSALPAIVEVINNYQVGWILPSLEPEDIGMKINAMLRDRAGLEKMQRNALAAASSEFCWEKESQKLINFYQEILAKHNERLGGKKAFFIPKLHLFSRR
jgi:glycosyltransferase involved in cell wall biosynthesis